MKKWELDKNIDEVVGFERILDRLKATPEICVILKVEDLEDKYLRIVYDIAEGDNKGLFKEAYDNDDRDEKKWSYSGQVRQYYYSAQNKKYFEAFITAVKKSNAGFGEWDWNEQKLVGKLFVANFGVDEYLSGDYDDAGNQIIKSPIKCLQMRSIPNFKAGLIKPYNKIMDVQAGQTKTPVWNKSDEVKEVVVPKGDFNKNDSDLPF